MTDEQKMMPCPLCGGSNIDVAFVESAVGRKIACRDCGASIARYKNYTVESVIAAWNKRVQPEGGEVLAALKAVNKIIAEAAMTGFNWKDGDWSERLFRSQQATSRAIKNAEPARAILSSDTGGDGVEDDAWLIRKGAYYYRPNRQGYTTRKADAGRYTEAEAHAEASIEPDRMSAVKASDIPDDPPLVSAYERGVNDMREACAKAVDKRYYPRDIVEKIRALPSPTISKDGWQPIQTGPDDGTPVLVGWDDPRWESAKGSFEGGVWGWLDANMGFNPFDDQPSHWMRLPKPSPATISTGSAK